MSIFLNRNTRLLSQGITGRDGSFHARPMIEYGTQVGAGVTLIHQVEQGQEPALEPRLGRLLDRGRDGNPVEPVFDVDREGVFHRRKLPQPRPGDAIPVADSARQA